MPAAAAVFSLPRYGGAAVIDAAISLPAFADAADVFAAIRCC